jgi:hypothetical protein
LMAMTVMAIGAAAVMSMQKASMQGNLDARKMDIANSITRTWVERLQRDAMQWTIPGPSQPVGSNFATAQLLSGNVTGQWFLPTQYVGSGVSPGFDILGRDLATTDLPTALFCANLRLTWLTPTLIRADVRVLWPRGISGAPPVGGLCTTAVAALTTPDPTVYHAIYAVTGIQENAQ